MGTQRGDRRKMSRGRKKDPAAAALAMQMLLCILLLLAAAAARQTDDARYTAVREEFLLLASDPAQSMDALNAFVRSGAGIGRRLTAAEERLTEMLDGMTEKRKSAGSAVGQTAEDAFDYDYLHTEEDGQGGLNPVETDGDFANLPAPEGSTFAEVAVTGQAAVPVSGRITSAFGYRLHPVTEESDFHTGMDIAAAEGTSILAALPGTVTEIGENDIYGHYILVKHAEGLDTFYAHCSEILAPEGAVVRRGERLAKVGETGVATGPHLHFSVLVDGQNTDPYWLLRDNVHPVN